MRHAILTGRARLLGLALLALLIGVLPAHARAGVAGHSKVDPRLAALAEARAPGDPLHVVVVGPDALAASTRARATAVRPLELVGGVRATVAVSNLEQLADDADVAFVGADATVLPQGNGDRTSGLATLYPPVDGAGKAWKAGGDGTGVGIAVIDSGVTPGTDFGSRLVQVRLPDQPGSLDDAHGHGSLVAGVAAGSSPDGRFVGIAPGATIYSIDVDRPEGVRSSDVISGLAWVFNNAHERNIRVVNLSLSEAMPSSYQTSALDLAVERLWAAGIVVVVAARNDGPGAVDFAPANDPLALTVGALDTNDTRGHGDDRVAGFSSRGLTVDGFAKPELVAPGRHIASVLPAGTVLDALAPAANRVAPGYASISGTSFAAPQVAGAAAILFQQHPGWSPDQVKWFLIEQARKVALSPVGALDLSKASGFDAVPGRANQGVPALVCAPGSLCIVGGAVGTVSSSWNSSSWNSSSWNSSSWNSSSWNSSSWNSSSWNSSSWNSSSWNSSSWNSSSWNSSSWNSSSWNSSSWN
ncbi:MAG: S8 family serine peptidase [Gaiellaceae bacterium]